MAATPQPRPHQVEALADIQRALAVHDRTQLVMACGTGKTFVGRWHAQAADAERVLVLLPSLALVAQTLREWRRATGNFSTGWRFRALVVCSDPTTTAGVHERDHDAGDTVDISDRAWAEQQARVTTDPGVAARFLRDHKPGHPQVIFSTYHSAPVVARAQASLADTDAAAFDLVICDESHRLAGKPSAAFATVLDPRAIVARKRLFMTATPKPFNGDVGYSMDDHAVFGPVAHTVTFGEAIASGMLTDYQVLVVAGADTSDKLQSVPAVLAKAVDEHDIHRVLSFHGRVAKAESFAATIDGLTTPHGRNIRARHVSGSMPTEQRTGSLMWLGDRDNTEIRVVSNARCLSEGVDVPAVDAVLFADQRSSVVDIIQAVGRALRPAPGKTRSTIILPLGLDEGDDDTSLAISDYSHVWTVLRGLRAHDQRLADDVDEVIREHARHGNRTGGYRIPRVNFVVPDGFAIEALQLRAVEEVGSAWERHYGHLQAWADEHDGRLIPRATKIELDDGTLYLGEWCEQQRILRRRGALSADRATRLEAIPGWAWDKTEAWWRNTHQILLAYAATHGTVADHQEGISRFAGMKNAAYPKRDLGVWMAKQRQAYRLGTLPDDYAAALEELPGWAWDGGLPAVDVEHVDALAQFVEFEKHANVPDDHREDGLRLGAWCWAVRRRKLNGRLSPVLHDEILAATPSKFLFGERFQWEVEETTWRLKYFGVRQFAEREGHSRPTGRTQEQLPDCTVTIGSWVALQRFKHRNGELDQRRIELLEALPGWEWEIELRTVEAEEPVDLTGYATDHGRPGAYGKPHFCRCDVCLEAKRQMAAAAARRKAADLVDPVPAEPVRAHLVAIEQEVLAANTDPGSRNGRTIIAALAGVALGQVRKIMNGTQHQLERDHADALLALTVEDIHAARTSAGSRGRLVSDLTARVDPEPTFKLLDDLAERGFGITWVGRELGYAGAPQLHRDGKIQARLATAVEDLYARVGDLAMPPLAKRERRPSLRELLIQQQGVA